MIFHCERCSDTGAIVAKHKISKNYYAFRCRCEARIERNKNYPMWQDKLQIQYDVDFHCAPYSDPKLKAANNNTDTDL